MKAPCELCSCPVESGEDCPQCGGVVITLDDHSQADANHWQDNQLQYARLIAELEQAGAFTSEIMSTLCLEMDLSRQNIFELIERACSEWDEQKRNTFNR